jgi:hypothetical protein
VAARKRTESFEGLHHLARDSCRGKLFRPPEYLMRQTCENRTFTFLFPSEHVVSRVFGEPVD